MEEEAPHIKPCNPYKRPLLKFGQDLRGIEWEVPYLPQVVESTVLCVVIVITCVLFLTIGIAAQLASIFQSLLFDARDQITEGTLIEKSAYAVAAGIYILLWLPIFFLLLPFLAIGWIWNALGYWGLLLTLLIVVAFSVPAVRNTLINFVDPLIERYSPNSAETVR